MDGYISRAGYFIRFRRRRNPLPSRSPFVCPPPTIASLSRQLHFFIFHRLPSSPLYPLSSVFLSPPPTPPLGPFLSPLAINVLYAFATRPLIFHSRFLRCKIDFTFFLQRAFSKRFSRDIRCPSPFACICEKCRYLIFRKKYIYVCSSC